MNQRYRSVTRHAKEPRSGKRARSRRDALAVPTEPTEIVSFGHDDTDVTATYADVVAQGTPLPAFTRRGIWRTLTCP